MSERRGEGTMAERPVLIRQGNKRGKTSLVLKARPEGEGELGAAGRAREREEVGEAPTT